MKNEMKSAREGAIELCAVYSACAPIGKMTELLQQRDREVAEYWIDRAAEVCADIKKVGYHAMTEPIDECREKILALKSELKAQQ